MKETKVLLRNLKSVSGPFPNFNTEDLTDYPSDLFLQWLNVAIVKGVHEPQAMILSTVDEQGVPDARPLILKDISKNKWYFSTLTTSRKGEQLKFNPNVALTFYWSEIGRQVRIRGVASETSKEESSKDFLERSREARALTLLGNQSKEMATRKDLDVALLKTSEILRQHPQTVCFDWKLFSVLANEVEFWQGDPDRKHIRVQYKLNEGVWKRRLLWP